MSMTDYDARIARRHADEVAKGLHDEKCEQGKRRNPTTGQVTTFYICGCRKRTRERSGATTLPDELEFRPPCCPACYADLEHDGDSWTCEKCHVRWDGNGTSPEWTDDYGDFFAAGFTEKVTE